MTSTTEEWQIGEKFRIVDNLPPYTQELDWNKIQNWAVANHNVDVNISALRLVMLIRSEFGANPIKQAFRETMFVEFGNTSDMMHYALIMSNY